ncbi:hypothetical protein [Nostoc sp. 2RC]|nr:hypothetical protein [Nostoc sp. 2RC]
MDLVGDAFLLCCIFVIQLLNSDRCCWNWEAIASAGYYSSLRRRN